VALLKWLRSAYRLRAEHLQVLLNMGTLAHVAARGHLGALRCLREDFGATDDDIRGVIHDCVDDMMRHSEGVYTGDDYNTLDVLLDTLTQTWRE
jgi:hypothetical protein